MRQFFLRYLRWEPARGKGAFVRTIPDDGRVLDVGCGNNSPQWFKTVRPDIYYIGLDVGDYNQSNDPSEFADEYVITPPDQFACAIEQFRGGMDAVVSCHNLEHCDDPARVLAAMVAALKPGGKLYLSFPCEASVRFPRRGGCLNFFDDSSHKNVPCWASTIQTLEESGCHFEFAAKRYRPFPLLFRGLFLEPVSMYKRHVIPDGSTWALYGFESVIWATVPGSCTADQQQKPSQQQKPLVMIGYGPDSIVARKDFNVQPNGENAIWVNADNVTRHTVVVVNNVQLASSPKGDGKLITAALPKKLYAKPGVCPIYLLDTKTGMKSNEMEFVVLTRH
jgi:SAM-dependent methyltransferase